MKKFRWLFVILLLGIMFVLGLFSLMGDSGTTDEVAHIPAGYSYLKYRDFRLNPEHPPLIKVWDTLPEIHFGATASYSEIAKRIGNHKAVRAVGAANGKNPIIIIVPCHRIIGSNGKLVGFGGGLWRKKWLLQHEQNLLL